MEADAIKEHKDRLLMLPKTQQLRLLMCEAGAVPGQQPGEAKRKALIPVIVKSVWRLFAKRMAVVKQKEVDDECGMLNAEEEMEVEAEERSTRRKRKGVVMGIPDVRLKQTQISCAPARQGSAVPGQRAVVRPLPAVHVAAPLAPLTPLTVPAQPVSYPVSSLSSSSSFPSPSLLGNADSLFSQICIADSRVQSVSKLAHEYDDHGK